MRYHVHGIAYNPDDEDDAADFTLTMHANDDADAQERAWEFFALGLTVDVSEIEEVDE